VNPKTHPPPPLDRGGRTRLPAPPASPSAQGKPGRRFGIYLALSLLLLVTGAGWGQGSGWKWLTGGNLTKVKFIRQQGWIIGDDGNQGIILHTTDGGNTWVIQPHNTGRHYFNGLSVVDSLNVWIGGGSIGGSAFILRTRDGGRSWVEEYNRPGMQVNDIDYVDTLHGWFTGSFPTADSIYRTTNGGITWQGIEPDTNRRGYGPIDFIDTLRGYAAAQAGVFYISRTTDGGLTWSYVRDFFLPNQIAIDMADSLKGWTAGSGGVIVRTHDGWRTWQTSATGTIAGLFDVSFSDTLNGYVAGGLNGVSATIFHSTNGGVSWTLDSTLTKNEVLYGVDAVDGNTAYATGPAGSIVKTSNAGSSWVILHNADIKQFALLNVSFYDPNLGWATGTNGVITHTTNGGTVWNRQVSGTFNWLYGVDTPDPQKGWVCGELGTILGTTDGGNTWVAESSGDTLFTLYSIDFADTLLGIAVGGGNRKFDDSEEGEFWGLKKPYLPGRGMNSMPSEDSLKMGSYLQWWLRNNRGSGYRYRAIAGEEGINPLPYRVITRTTNGGGFWSARIDTGQNALSGVSFVTPQAGWACGLGGIILHTTDGGASWTPQTSNTSNWLAWITFNKNARHGWSCGGNGTVIWTTDGGSIWTPGNTGTTNGLVSCAFADTLIGFAVSGNGLIIKTVDGGRNWFRDSSGTTINFEAVCVIDTSHAWAVGGGYGMVFGWGEAGNTGIEERVQGVQGPRVQGTALGQSHPNPTRGIASFEYELGKAGKVRVRVYNIAGQAVRTLVEGMEPAGRHVVVWDGRDEAGRKAGSGTYFYQLEAGGRKTTRKLIVIR